MKEVYVHDVGVCLKCRFCLEILKWQTANYNVVIIVGWLRLSRQSFSWVLGQERGCVLNQASALGLACCRTCWDPRRLAVMMQYQIFTLPHPLFALRYSIAPLIPLSGAADKREVLFWLEEKGEWQVVTCRCIECSALHSTSSPLPPCPSIDRPMPSWLRIPLLIISQAQLI